jgi:hypothetical protein
VFVNRPPTKRFDVGVQLEFETCPIGVAIQNQFRTGLRVFKSASQGSVKSPNRGLPSRSRPETGDRICAMTCFDNSVLPWSGCRIAPEPIASCRAVAEQSAQAWDMGLSRIQVLYKARYRAMLLTCPIMTPMTASF